jgi:hypothetical protein
MVESLALGKIVLSGKTKNMKQQIDVKNLTEYFVKMWNECRPEWKGSDEILPSEKQQREDFFEKFLDSMNAWSNRKQMKTDPAEKFTPQARLLFRNVFGYPDDQLDIILSEEYKGMTKDFIRKSRRFDPAISLDDIFQACRNAWIMNGIQIMLGQPVRLTDSIFAYSMLYPYTDNYLDNPLIGRETKYLFNQRFRAKLDGMPAVPENEDEAKIFRLVEMIEDEWDRDSFPKVFESLLAIHDAQSKSLRLIRPGSDLTEPEILDICIEKGGTSVMADGYLVAGNLTVAQELFLYGFGAFLQLVDDIQDVGEDSKAGQMTVFSKASEKCSLDDFTSRTFCFGDLVFDMIGAFNGNKTGIFKALIKRSVGIMMVETILLNTENYTAAYVENAENFSPLSISYLQKRRSKMSPQRISYMKKIIESVVDDL